MELAMTHFGEGEDTSMATTGAQRVLAWCDTWNHNHPWDHNAHYHSWILRRLPTRIDRALDVGCGTGDLARRLTRRASHVDAVDVDEASIQVADRLSRDAPSLRFIRGDLLTADLRPGYEAITAVAVLHHMPLEPALRRLRDLLAPGGTLIILGVYREHSRSDRLLSSIAVPANVIMGAVKAPHRRRNGSVQRPISMSAPTTPARITLTQVREAAKLQLGDVATRRHLFWRYSLVYRAPQTPPA